MDAGFSESFRWALDNGVADVILSYDIACKYSVNFLKRVKTNPNPLLPDEIDKHIRITWLIGKFHLGGHKEECSKKYSFNYNKNVGRMSGELVETIWATFNALKPQTREMGPGPRREVLTDAMNFWNKMKEGRLSTCRVSLIGPPPSHIYNTPTPRPHHAPGSIRRLGTSSQQLDQQRPLLLSVVWIVVACADNWRS